MFKSLVLKVFSLFVVLGMCSHLLAHSLGEHLGVGHAASALGTPDGAGAELFDAHDQLVLQLDHALTHTEHLSLTLRRQDCASPGSSRLFVYASATNLLSDFCLADVVDVADGATFSDYTVLTPSGTRFIKLSTESLITTGGVLVDAIHVEETQLSALTSTGPCLNTNGDFASGSTGWTIAGGTMNFENGALLLNQTCNVYTTITVTADEAYEILALLQSNDADVRIEAAWYNGVVFLSRDVLNTVSPKRATNYRWLVRAPANATRLRLTFFNLQSSRTRIDDVCIRSAPNATPPPKGCLNHAIGPLSLALLQWRSDRPSEVKFEDDAEDQNDVERPAIEIKKEFVQLTTIFPASPNTTYQLETILLGENANDKLAYVSIEWLDALGNVISTTSLINGKKVPKVWTTYNAAGSSPNDPRVKFGRLVYEVRKSGKIWVHHACITETGRAGVGSSIAGGVFEDRNGNGRWDAYSGGDPWVEDNLVVLFRDNGDGVQQPDLDEEVARMSTTLSDGYAFAGLPEGDYFVVAFVAPTRLLGPIKAFGASGASIDNDFYLRTWRSTSVGWTDILKLDGTASLTHIDMGMVKSGLAAVVGYIWADTNADSYNNEPPHHGLNGITVRSIGPLGTLVTKTQNGPDGTPGFFIFNYVQPQTVLLQMDIPAGTSVRAKVGDNTFKTDGRTDPFPLQPDNTVWNRSAAMATAGVEVCGNGIDDDLDGKIDDFDSDCSTCTVPEQVVCGEDFTYYMPPLWRMGRTFATFQGPSLLRFTTAANTTNVRIRTANGMFDKTVVVSKDTPQEVLLTSEYLGQTDQQNQVQADVGFIITSAAPIEATYYLDGELNRELVTLKGYHALGNRFRAGSQVAQHSADVVSPVRTTCTAPLTAVVDQVAREAHFISVMASENNTRVTFTWDASRFTAAGGISSPHVVTLNRGQTYLIRDNYTNQTVSGILVESDKAIAVVSGSQHTANCESWGRDAGIDQLVPTCYLGTEYAVVKHPGFATQHYAIVVADASGTQVTADGSPTVLATLNAGEWFRYRITGAVGDVHLLKTSNPAYVYHVSGISAYNNEVGMAISASIDQCSGNKYLRFLRGRVGDQYLSLITNTAALGTLNLNNQLVTGLAGVTVRPLPGKPSQSAVTIPETHLLPVNELAGTDYFQAALLIAISAESGLFGYLTAFAPTIEVIDPATSAPAPRYRMPTICAGDMTTHTLQASSCQGGTRIVSISNNTSLGAVTQAGLLTFVYSATATGGGEDLISLRLRDNSGLETSVCLNITVCGPNINIIGLPNNATLTCHDAIPSSNPKIVGNTCPIAGPITSSDVTTSGSCANNYRVTRTWRVTAECGSVIERSREFTFVDDQAPVIANVPADVILECNATLAVPTLTTSDGCDPAPTITYSESACGSAESPAYYTTGGTTVFLAEVRDDPDLTYPSTPIPLGLTALATYDPNVELRWRVRNSNAFPVYFRYEGSGVQEVTGHFVVPANTDLYWFTPRLNAAVKLHFYNESKVWTAITAAPSYAQATIDAAATCGCTKIRTWTATDNCGNVRTEVQRLHYVDRNAPVISNTPAGKTICATDALPTELPTVSDNCGTPTITTTLTRVIGPGTDSTITRLFTVSDGCGNTSTSSQVIRKLAAPAATVAPTAATCGGANGAIVLSFPNHAVQTSIQFGINGSWAAAVNDNSGSYTFSNLAAGNYTITARWSGLACPVTLGSYMVQNHSASLGATQVYDVDAGTAGLTLVDGGTYFLEALPARWSLRSAVSGSQASVTQTVTGAASGTRSANAPASFYPSATAPTNWGIGSYTLQVTAFAKTGASGPVCQTTTIRFQLFRAEDCSNGIDDDGDGLIDCLDEDCPAAAPVTRVTRL